MWEWIMGSSRFGRQLHEDGSCLRVNRVAKNRK